MSTLISRSEALISDTGQNNCRKLALTCQQHLLLSLLVEFSFVSSNVVIKILWKAEKIQKVRIFHRFFFVYF
jgi:hypothetical protein